MLSVITKRNIIICFILSLLLHSIVLYKAKKSCGKGNGQHKSKGQPGAPVGVDANIVEMIQKHIDKKDYVPKKVPISPDDIIVKREKKPKKKRDCKKFFGGIGIHLVLFSPEIIVDKVIAGYPADEAGLLKGDKLQIIGGRDIVGEIGTPVRLLVTRGLKTFELTIIRGKICYE